MKPLVAAIAVIAIAGGLAAPDAQAQARPFSSGWMAAKGAARANAAATGRLPGGTLSDASSAGRQQQQARQQLNRSLANVGTAAAAIAAQQAAQAAARAVGRGDAPVPEGYAPGGLWDKDAAGNPLAWRGAERPVAVADANGERRVSVKQTDSKAVLNWDTFNVGRNTRLEFQQGPNDAVLNRVVGADARPSQIQGAIRADGTVMVVNQNGVVFSGSSQVNVRNLVAAAARISDAQFQEGLYGANSAPTFSEAIGQVRVEQGARISTHEPASSTSGGGYVLLAGKQVENAGALHTPRGQSLLAAGDSFIIKKGQGTEGNPQSTTRGNEVTAAGEGLARNTGLIQSPQGDITLTASAVEQAGVLASTTSVNHRGTIHLNASGDKGSVRLAQNAVSAILVDASADVALDTQRAGLLKPTVDTGEAAIVPADDFRRDLSLVRIVSGGTADFEKGSLTLATGGQVVVDAGKRTLVREGAIIDVAGAVGVAVAMESNSVKINIQGNEQRDAPVNRESGKLNSSDVWVDVRDLVLAPAGTNGYASDRWYTAGGLLEVGGYLGTQGRSAGQWLAQGGTVRFTGAELVTQAGSQVNLSGGTLDVQDGYLQQSWLRGADGRLYEVSNAPGDLPYTGLYRGYEATSKRWGHTRRFYNPLIAPTRRWEPGYTVGRDAGLLVVGSSSAVLEGEIVSDVYQGPRQSRAAQAGVDGFSQSQRSVARGGQLVVGAYTPYYVRGDARLTHALGMAQDPIREVVIGNGAERIAAGLDLQEALPEDRRGRLLLDSGQLARSGLSAVRIAAPDIVVDAALQVASGGEIVLAGPRVDVRADLVARSGVIRLGNVLTQVSVNGRVEDVVFEPDADTAAWTRVADGVALDASGVRADWRESAWPAQALPYVDGGLVSVRASGDVTLGAGSLVDVTGGAHWTMNNGVQGGRGGDATLAANAGFGDGTGTLRTAGAIRGHGVRGGGELRIESGRVVIGDALPVDGADGALVDALLWRTGDFDLGFAQYTLAGRHGLDVQRGAQIDVTMPVLRDAQGSLPRTPGELAPWLPPAYSEDIGKAVLTLREGAGLTLQAGSTRTTDAQRDAVALSVGEGARIGVDPGRAIDLASAGNLTVQGALHAPGGRITLTQLLPEDQAEPLFSGVANDRAIRIGSGAVLDASGKAWSAVDARGRRYARVDAGGSIVIGAELDDTRRTSAAPDLFVVVEQGAQLLANGTAAVVDAAGRGATTVASSGGVIALASNNGMVLEGTMRAASGGAGAAGGHLKVALEAPRYDRNEADDVLRAPRELVLAHGPAQDADAHELRRSYARLDVDRMVEGGFDNASLLAGSFISFDGDVSLKLGQSLALYAGALTLAETSKSDARIALGAPYVRLAGAAYAPQGEFNLRPTLNSTNSAIEGTGGKSDATLSVQAGLLDVRDRLTLGASGQIQQQDYTTLAISRRGFDTATLASDGDIRFVASSPIIADSLAGSSSTRLIGGGDLRLMAAQIYPTTGAYALLKTADSATLSLGRTTGALPATPDSAFGRLIVDGGVIEQGGVLRAPLGVLELGAAIGGSDIRLLPGSVTSASGAGLLMPYGGTTDGLSYRYDGQEATLLGAGGTTFNQVTAGVAIYSKRLAVDQGALIDLSGGGELLGAGFVSGRGGSTDVRYHPLMRQGADGLVLPSLADHPVYAIVPGVQKGVAPVTPEAGASDAMIGQQITLAQGVPGLPAGTYTLLPSTYALLPGAFRVELSGTSRQAGGYAPLAMRNGSWSASGQLSVAGTGIAEALSRPVLLTPADTVRKLSQYNEMSYAQFVQADAALKGVPRAMIEADARALMLKLAAGESPEETFSFAGAADFRPARNGLGGTVGIFSQSDSVEIVAAGRQRTADFNGTSLRDADLNALGASRLSFGILPQVTYGQGGNMVFFSSSQLANVHLREGATLRAGEVLMLSSRKAGVISIEAGAAINTIGAGLAPFDSRGGFVYDPGVNGMLAVSNGWLDVLPAASDGSSHPGTILIGNCTAAPCGAGAVLYSEGTLTVATDNTFQLGEGTRFGARKLALAVGAINVGNTQALEDAAGRGALPSGLTLNQPLLERLLGGDTSAGVPALEELSLTARDAIGFYGDVTLSTRRAGGSSSMVRLALGAPALYGAGAAGERALIQTRELVWLGNAQAPVAPVAGGAGTGNGVLDIEVERLVLGYGPNSRPDNLAASDRLALGFSAVNIRADQEVTANGKGTLSVYQRRAGYVEGKGATYEGGRLTITTPVWTGEAGSESVVRTGELIYSGLPGAAVPADSDQALGAHLTLDGQRVQVNGLVRLPSGKLALRADGDVSLGAGAHLDLAGRVLQLNDVTQATAGGDVILESRQGNIAQHADAVIDVSARGNNAGSLSAVALAGNAGRIDLSGRILGGTEGYYDAGGTWLPHAFGRVEIRGQDLGDFAALNGRLTRDQVFGARSFQIKRGDLAIGDELRANQIDVSVDGGSLTVNGRIDAGGARVGSIRLAAGQNLTINGSGVLDAHGATLRVDSHGAIIDSPNRAIVELAAREGTLTLASGARIDLRHGADAATGNGPGLHDGRARGTLTLNAPRANQADPTWGDIALEARGALDILGARDIVVLGTQRYADAPVGAGLNAAGNAYRSIDQAYLDAKHIDSTAFIGNALGNAALMQGKLAGLNNDRYRDAFHLRPGVEIVSAGDLAVVGDVDLSGHRYASINPRTLKTTVYGSGESGNLVLRASGNLDVLGSVTDGFAPPDWATGTVRRDGKGWILAPGVQPIGNDIVIPRTGVVLAEGTAYPSGQKLNFAVPYAPFTLPAGAEMPAQMTLAQALTVPAGTQLHADIHGADGALLYAAGTRLNDAVTLPVNARLGAGSRLAVAAPVQGGMWPAGVAVPATGLKQRGALPLAVGAYIPSGVDVKLPEGAGVVDLRPATGGPGGDQQGRNWALGTLLPEGSQSWSLRLAAGADLGAADTRLTRPDAAAAALRLADAHYTATSKTEGGVVKNSYVWSDTAPPRYKPGAPVTPNLVSLCTRTPSYCVLVSSETTPIVTVVTGTTQQFSVLRTGAGDLDLVSGGDFRMDSLYGVYTAGAQSASLASGGTDPYQQPRGSHNGGNSVLGASGSAFEALAQPIADGGAYAAWYPENGGNLLLSARGDLTGNLLSSKTNEYNSSRKQRSASIVGNWLWRQGTGARSDGMAELPAAWWVNFGAYALPPRSDAVEPYLVGFTGIGTLGGGNVDVRAGGDAGLVYGYGETSGYVERSQGLLLAIGSTGRVGPDGALVQTGGGDLSLRVAGAVNPSPVANARASQEVDLYGALVNLRGELRVQAGAIGEIGQVFGSYAAMHNVSESRAYQPYVATTALSRGGFTVVPGDSAVRMDTRGDLVLQGVGDAGRIQTMNTSPFADGSGNTVAGGGFSNFSLWTPHSAMNLMSAGGNLTPIVAVDATTTQNAPLAGGVFTYPSILRALAPRGSLYYGSAAGGRNNASATASLVLAPSASGILDLVAGDSIYAAGYVVTRSGANPDSVATPLRPAFAGYGTGLGGSLLVGNHGEEVTPGAGLFAFGADRYSASWSGASEPARFYAMDGDIIGLRTGEILTFPGQTLYQGSGPARVIAGRDIVNAGTTLGGGTPAPAVLAGAGTSGVSTGNLIIHANADDVSLIEAGRDIRLSSFHVAGPGHLSLVAGRNLYASGPGVGNAYQEVNYTSLGAADAAAPLARGASISIMAGAGPTGPDYAALLARYLDPAHRLPAGAALADMPNGAVRTYEGRLTLAQWLREKHGYRGGDEQAQAFLEGLQASTDADPAQPRRIHAKDYEQASQVYLVNWLEAHHGYAGGGQDALAYFQALAPEQQAIYARQVYFAELREGGREYNDPASPRLGSYLRGREAIATLFPAVSRSGAPAVYQGGVTMYGGAGIHTYAGGDIQVLTPGGQQIYGVEGSAPPATAGVLTQGEGHIQLYSQGSILLGQSRIMTTFGGNIQAWSAQGDINAGRGAKTTVLYTPPRRLYDALGNVSVSPQAPSMGAGIATDNPIPEVPPGDVDLIAPLGTIDAGEAGIRVSGNLNIAALHVANAANVQVQGEAAGIPVVAAVNAAALTSASAAASSAASTAQDAVERSRNEARQSQPSIFSVQILGFGNEGAGGVAGSSPAAAVGAGAPEGGYRPDGMVQILGDGKLTDAQASQLTPEERRRVGL
ncbi:filamentous hemagglutinin family protein [Achromobacter deleyi]|nr:filamentous haemagglutinin family protein [Achromobacter deleyi]UIP18682.1 filamentous hemagglutinin family protein [Achromobacter deleyi]